MQLMQGIKNLVLPLSLGERKKKLLYPFTGFFFLAPSQMRLMRKKFNY